MNFSEHPLFEEISSHLEIEMVARELSILDEAAYESESGLRLLAAASFKRAKMELLEDPATYFIKRAETARDTWEQHPDIAKYMYTEDDKE